MDTAAAVRKKLLRGDSCGGVGLLGERRGNGPLWVDWVMKRRERGGLGERGGGGGGIVCGEGELNSIFPRCRSSCWVGWVMKRREGGGGELYVGKGN